MDRNDDATGQAATTAQRQSEREVVVTRTIDAPQRLVFEAWADPELFRRWWAPASCGMTIASFEADIRTGGRYRLEMSHPAAEQPMAFFGRYLEVTPPSRLVWTNEEAAGGSVTTVTFEEKGGATLMTVHELYPSKEACDEAIASGATGGWGEQFAQLDALVGAPRA